MQHNWRELLQLMDRFMDEADDFETAFANKNMIFCCDLRQLPAVRQIPFYNRTTLHIVGDCLANARLLFA